MATDTDAPRWLEADLARIDARDLAVLADCRRAPGVRVAIEGGRARVYWNEATAETRRAIIERLWPLSSVEFFVKRDNRWHRPGAHLPAFDAPREIEDDANRLVGLERALLPRPLVATAPERTLPRPSPLRLSRELGRSQPIAPCPASALRCRLGHLAAWADCATSARIESLSAAWSPGVDVPDAEVLVLGIAAALPEIPEGTRYWGTDVLLPLGFALRFRPETAGDCPVFAQSSEQNGTVPLSVAVWGQSSGLDLPAAAVRAAVGAGPDDLLVFDEDGPELVPRAAFSRLRRAAIRRAFEDEGGRRP